MIMLRLNLKSNRIICQGMCYERIFAVITLAGVINSDNVKDLPLK
jgi:hypothetical protein